MILLEFLLNSVTHIGGFWKVLMDGDWMLPMKLILALMNL